MPHTNLIIFSDLDGTLLDHETYSYDAASEALAKLKAQKIPLILTSSKTAAEMAPLRAELGFAHCPAIVENGGGILPPEQLRISEASRYAELLEALKKVSPDLRACFTGFADLSDDEVAKDTGLPKDQARLAKDRAFSEPGRWSGTEAERQQFIKELKALGVVVKQGGRYMTLSFGGDKAARLVEVVEMYADRLGSMSSVALGDAPNDKSMLEAADTAVIINNPAHGGIDALEGKAEDDIIRPALVGPAGWNKAILQLIDVWLKQ